MYQPAHFVETRAEVLHQAIRLHPLATLVTEADGVPVADEIPFLIEADGHGQTRLRAHIARANPLWKKHPAGRKVLVIFRGPQAYISPSYYPSKQQHGRVVPTWNYTLVQAVGSLQAIEDPAWIRAQIDALTAQQEAGRAAPWAVGDAPDDFIAQMTQAIVGLEVVVESLTGKWKTSQNRSADDRLGVVQGLRARSESGAPAMANLVESTIF